MPLMTVFLREMGNFSYLQIGLAMSLMNLPILCSPALITLMADRNVDPRKLLSVAFGCSAVVLSLLFFSQSIVLTMILFVFHGLAFGAMFPLQDGCYFSAAEEAKRSGIKNVISYPKVRVWGTIGFILPGLILYFPLVNGASARAILPVAIGFCILSLLNSLTLPRINRIKKKSKKLPTKVALQTIFSPEARWLSVGLFFAYMGASTYYAFVGNFYVEIVKIPKHYIGLILNIGVILEIGFTMAMPWLQKKIHLKGVVVAGLFVTVVRLFLLAFYPTKFVVIATQMFVGLEVLALFIGPVMFIDRLAGDEFRISVQGVFTMTVGGISRVIAGVVAGMMITKFGLQGTFLYAGVLALIGFLIITFLFSTIPPKAAKAEEIGAN